MLDTRHPRLALIFGVACAIAVLSAAVWSSGYRQALTALAERSASDLALASDRVSTQLQIFREQAVLVVTHPALRRLDEPVGRRAAEVLLRGVADKTGALDVFYADAQGQVLAAAEGVAGRNVSDKRYFRRAMQGAMGAEPMVLPAGNRRAYFFAAPDFGPRGQVRGTLVVVADIEVVEQTWRGSLPAVYFTIEDGRVFMSNRFELLFWQRDDDNPGLRMADGGDLPLTQRYVGTYEIWQQDWSPYLPSEALHLGIDLPAIGMRGEILVDVTPAQRIALLQTLAMAAVCLAFGTILFWVAERRRTLAETNAALELRVDTRTRALSEANQLLRREVRERREAEAALKQAQAELVQADKLSALGQMSAGISHELNQPLMAIQQFAENGQAFVARGKAERAGENLNRIAQMSARMARIIKNLRAFARNESEPVGKVDLLQVINAAVELTETRLRDHAVTLDWHPEATGPIFARGGEVRLTQVFVNLINNATDAMLEQPDRHITIAIDPGPRLAVTVQDIGPGLHQPEKVFEPFYTTKAVGSSEGMGLGLSISYGLVQSFGGNIRGTNTARGALFTVELEHWKEEDAA
ncbi:ATP-binding protein [Tritonibacter scottomollicae]|uniref:C4-dicarboxylate transport sensor protein DctB n=1 Tax=Tritonibacter scottomollicae TaxID=483013 RepID=A0A2T1AIT7_TRISK|nr:ATP-binding protein [Tritonibacter scottomollicae]PRZ48525.1 two-component system C4-dicarboxylate transport sensor histidine kinase DctB [Tritonibacter scottomollicae]